MLSDYRKETINRLQMLNGQLRQFISSQNGANANMMIDNTPENVSQSICTKAVQQYKRIRVHAKTVYQLLDEYLLPPVCDCPSTHYACLQLEVRVNGQSSSLNLGGRQSEVFLNMMISAKDLRKAPSICTELLLEGVESRASFKPRTQSLVIPTSTEPPQPVQDPAGAGQKPVVKISIGSHIRASAKKFIPSIFPKGKSRIHESVVPDSTVTLKPTLIPPRKPKKIVSFSRGDDINSSQHHNSALADRLGYKHLEVDGATLKRIDSLCSAINISPGNNNLSHCLGILSPNTDTTIQTRAWIPSPNPLLLGLVKVVSLEYLISSNSLPKPPLKSRIALAVTLASSVMQLHSTAWLNDLWSISDIWFLKQDTSIEHILERPLIYKPFSHSKITEVSIPTITQNSVWRVLAPNKDLLSLGIALIELLEWRSFESIQNDKSYNLLLEPSVDLKLNRYLAAKQMVDYLKKQCRDNDLYFNSLRRCIEGLDHAGKTLDRDDFKKQVYRLIVRPLEVHLRQGWGC
ncbi:hypothetical protein L211DRAFT_4483 [Terfezia boudieri ATCC MYA-4762]|uniref:DUF7580 domain-containing protein n=1 Tax=Terfezia boudieri ATCC MYA-4762 TaxID=1051890 RepID=A0A3N4M9Y0_9PEZI|nr:hypothetical protein L211DRAFT_4483 [Terfezia boudieri ATCC MYA-4762]